MRMHSCEHCSTFRSVCIPIENANASHTHPILMVLYHVYGACSLTTVKGVHGIVNSYALQETHFGLKWQTRNANITQTSHIRSTFRSVCIPIENANASHTHPILMVLYHVYGACSLTTVKGVHGIVNSYALQETHFGLKWQTRNANITQTSHIRSKGGIPLLSR